MSSRVVRLAAIATVAGAFSGLFGVGGGTVIVPLLILWLGYEEREATGTSLAAIIIIAVFGTLAQAALRQRRRGQGRADRTAGGARGPGRHGAPAAGLRPRHLGAFAVLLVVSAVLLIV